MAPSDLLRVVPAALLVCTLLLVTAPPAVAQTEAVVDPPVTLTVTVAPHGDPIKPNLDLGTATANVTVTCTAPGIYTKPVEVLHNAGSPSAFGFASPVTIVEEVEFAPEECKAQTASRSYDVLVDVSLTSTAPAFELVPFTFTATANTTSGTGHWNETAGFAGDLQADVIDQFREEEGKIPVEGVVQNGANGVVLVTVEVAVAPQHGRIEPPELELEVEARGTASTEAPFRFDYISTEREIDTFSLRVTAVAKGDPAQALPTRTIEVTIDPENNAIYSTSREDNNSPPAAVLWFVGATVGLLALLRRR